MSEPDSRDWPTRGEDETDEDVSLRWLRNEDPFHDDRVDTLVNCLTSEVCEGLAPELGEAMHAELHAVSSKYEMAATQKKKEAS